MHLSKTFFASAKQRRSRVEVFHIDCEKPFAEGVATADASATNQQNLITAKGDVL